MTSFWPEISRYLGGMEKLENKLPLEKFREKQDG